MPEKKVSIVVKARNKLAVGLAEAGATLKKFGRSAGRIAGVFAKGFLAAGTAVAAFSAKLLQAFSVQEKAERQAEAAFRAYGEEVTNNTQKVKDFAAQIQNETGIADENTIARAAQLKLLGVGTGQLEAATKATIALQKAGMGEATAAKAVAAAVQGDFEALQRYIPALKTATSDAEKAAIVNDFVTKGYAAQKDELNTVGGQWDAFKGRIGDVLEQLGGVIAQDGALTGMLKRAADGVQAFGERVARWVGKGGPNELIMGWQLFFESIRNGFNQTSAWVNVARAAIVDGFANAWDTVKKIFTGRWKEIGDYQAKRTVAALAVVEQSQKEHAERVAKISERGLKKDEEIANAKVKVEKQAQEQIVVAVENAQKRITAAKSKEEKLAKELASREQKAKQDALQKELEGLQKAQDKRKELSKKTVEDILEEQRAQQEAATQGLKDVRKAERLREKQARGVKLGRKALAFLAAQTQIEEAAAGLQGGKAAIDNAKEQLANLNEQSRTLADIRGELQQTRQQLNALLMRK